MYLGNELAYERVRSLAEIARREDVAKRYVEMVADLTFVAPAMVEAICDGREPNLQTLLKCVDITLDWAKQLTMLDVR